MENFLQLFRFYLFLAVGTTELHPNKENNGSVYIFFGSCSYQHEDPKIFLSMSFYRPSVFVWTGDSIYLDFVRRKTRRYKQLIPQFFEQANNTPSYKFFRTRTPNPVILGTWDDHDSAGDNCNGDFELIEYTKPHFLDFLGEPRDSERYKRKRGVYDAQQFVVDGQSVTFLLLDVRSFATRKGPRAALLGEEQWTWLDEQLAAASGVVVLFSGIQVLPSGKLLPGVEFWAQYGDERARLLALLAEHKGKYVLVSGDIHYAELNVLPFAPLGYDLVELTSSGLTHHLPLLVYAFMGTGTHHRASFLGKNFGGIDFRRGALFGLLFDETGKVRIEQEISFVPKYSAAERAVLAAAEAASLQAFRPRVSRWLAWKVERTNLFINGYVANVCYRVVKKVVRLLVWYGYYRLAKGVVCRRLKRTS